MESLFCKHTWGIVCLVCDQGVQLTPSPPRALCLPCDRQRQISSRGLHNSSCRLGRCTFPSSLGQNTSWLDQTTKSYTRIQQLTFKEACSLACPRPVSDQCKQSITSPSLLTLSIDQEAPPQHCARVIIKQWTKNTPRNTSYWLVRRGVNITCGEFWLPCLGKQRHFIVPSL